MRCISMTYVVMRCLCVCVCLSVCLSRSWVASKQIKISSKFFHNRVATPFYFFHTKRGGDVPTAAPLTGVSNAGEVGKKYPLWMNIWLRCIQVYSVINRTSCEVLKIKPRQTASSRALTAASVVRTRRRSVCDGLDVIRRRQRSNPPDTTPLVITPFSAAVGHRRTEPGGYFCWKLTLTRTPDPIRPMRQGPDPNRPTNGRKQEGYDLGVFVRGVWSDTAGDNRRQQNRI